MARKPTGNPPGRPQKVIDWSQFEQLCGLQCTQSEIASMLHTNVETIKTRVEAQYGDSYLDVYKRFAESGKCSLRRNQFVISKKNASMAIWLGKIWLGQKDPGLDEATKDILGEVKAAVREIVAEPRIGLSERSIVEDKQFILDKKRGWDKTEISVELGTENTMGGAAPL